MQYLQFTAARADTGAVLPLARVTVMISGTATKATLFDVNGTPVINPVVATSTGLAGFSAVDGFYDIRVTSADNNYAAPPILRHQFFDANAVITQTGADRAAIEAMVAAYVGPGYPDEPTGRAAVADGAYFHVEVTDGSQTYRRVNAATVSTLGPLMPSITKIASMIALANAANVGGYVLLPDAVTGTANAIVASLPSGMSPSAITSHKLVAFVAKFDNTGSPSLEITSFNTGDPRAINSPSGASIPAGTIKANRLCIVSFGDDFLWELVHPSVAGGSMSSAPSNFAFATQTNASGNELVLNPSGTLANSSANDTLFMGYMAYEQGEGGITVKMATVNPLDALQMRMPGGVDQIIPGVIPVGSYFLFNRRTDAHFELLAVFGQGSLDGGGAPSNALTSYQQIVQRNAANSAAKSTSIARKNAARLTAVETGKAAVTVFEKLTTSGTWTKPLDAKGFEVVCIGGGGGGGGGGKGATGTARSGGGGGGGGSRTRTFFAGSDLAATVSYVIGAGGVAGTGATVNGAGGSGGAGGQTNFGTSLYGFGGGGGSGGNITVGSGGGGGGGSTSAGASGAAAVGGGGGQNAGGGGSATVGSNATTMAGGGGGGTAAGAASTGGRGASGGSGGGSGAGLTSADAAAAGATGATSEGAPLTSGAAGTSGGGVGGTLSALIGTNAGSGGGGGGSSATVAGGAGGAGQFPGGGGGGGGASQAGNGGAGAVGGAGMIYIITHF